MALLKLSGLVTKISGIIGGSVLGTSQSGAYIKQNSYNRKQPSPEQSKQRTKIYLTTQYWRTLSVYYAGLWQAQTSNYPYINRVGDTVYYTGYQLFNYLQSNRLLIGLPIVNTPPVYSAPSVISYSASRYSIGALRLSYSDVLATDTIIVQATPSLPSYGKFVPSKMLQFLVYPNNVTNGDYDFTSEYVAKFGAFTEPSAIYLRCKIVNRTTGIPSRWGGVVQVAFGQ